MRDEAIRRRLEAADDDSESEDEDDEDGDTRMGDEEGSSQDHYLVPATGARVTRSNAKSLLFHYCNKLPSDKWVFLNASLSYVLCHNGYLKQLAVISRYL